MATIGQKTIEYFFEKYKVTNQEVKARLLLEITDIIYEYNMSVVKYEKETDEYKKKQILADIEEVEQKIAESIKDAQKK